MRVVISIEHPAWSHQFKNIIRRINKDGETLVLGINKDGDLDLLDAFGIKYLRLADSTGNGVFEKGYLFAKLCIEYTKEIRKFKPDLLIGRASPMMAIAAWLTGKPHVIFEDTEVSKFSLNLCKKFSKRIITPQTFMTDLGEKQERLPVYKELFYLHKDFEPNRDVVKKCGINPNEPYAIVRFVSWDASHDIGMNGLSIENKIRFIRKIQEFITVYISSESELPDELKKYKLDIPFDKIHHTLYYASLVFSEGASMASEAAILGTHSFYLNQIASGTTEEQEERFHLLRVLHDPKTRYDTAIKESRMLLEDDSLWAKGKEKREKLLKEMPDPNELFWSRMMEAVSK